MTKAELASMLRRFVGDEPNCGDWEWDDFISVRAAPDLEPYRQSLLSEVHPYLGREDKQAAVDAILRNTISELETTL